MMAPPEKLKDGDTIQSSIRTALVADGTLWKAQLGEEGALE
jgi:hypothetical protein